MIYLIILILIFYGVYRYDYRRNSDGKLLLWIVICLLMIIIAGLRYRLGGDTVQYISFYKNLHGITQLSDSDFTRSRFAPGFIVFASLCKAITDDIALLQTIVATIVNTVLFYFFWKNSKNCFFAILLYYFFLYTIFSMELMREALTVSIFLMAWPFFRDGKWLYWYLFSLLALTIHVSASIMLVLPFICLPFIRELFVLGKRTWFIWLGLIALAFSIYQLFFKYIEFLAITDSMMERSQAYQKNVLGGANFNINGIISYLIQYLLYPVGALYCIQATKRNEGIKNHGFNKFYAFVLICSYISLLTLFINILGRFNNYFLPFALLIVSDWVFSKIILWHKKIKLGFVYWIIIVLPLFAVHARDHYFNDVTKSGSIKFYSLYYPYNSILDPEKDADREKAIKNLRKRY